MDPESPDLELVVGGRPVRFPAVWLRDNCGDGRTEDDKELWLPGDLAGLPAMSWPSYLAGGKAEALEAVLRVGFVLLSGVPAEPGRVLEVAASFGYVRETNYDRLHARTAFSMNPGSPERHLQGCYADLDGLASTLAILSRSGNHGREESR